MSELTLERLAELRRIAEAATPGPWEWDKYLHLFSSTGKPVLTKPFSTDNPDVVEAMPEDLDYIERFNPETALALLDEIERLRKEREVLADVLRHVHTCENCECALCPEGTELSYRAYRTLGAAMDLLDGEEIVGNVTRFVLYDPDLNAWECQACRFWWEFEDGDPYEHDMRFCPRCGRWIMREAQQKHS